MDFFARQEAARRATRWLLVAFIVCVWLVASTVGAVVYAIADANAARELVSRGGDPLTPGIIAGVITLCVIGGASLFKTLSLRAGGGVVARSLGGTRVERGTRDLALKRLLNVVEEMSIASGVPMPEVYVLEHEDGINAFAAGNSPADAAVAVTRGALTRLTREELQGVIAHEFSHVLNGDMRLNSKLLGWVFGLLAVAIAARLFLRSGATRGGRRDDKGALLLIALAIMIIGYIGVLVGRILQAAVSRHRERLADASAVQFTRNPQGLVGALLKIAGVKHGSKIESPDREEVAHMLFAPGMARLFSTHPPITERVRALNPALRIDQIKTLATTAASEAEKLRFAPAFPDVAPASGIAPATVAADTAAAAARVAGLAGTFDEIQVRYAREARRALPEALQAYADSADDARVLLFALLRGADSTVAARQDDVIREIYGDALLARILETLPLVRDLAPALRLPAVQQLLPALRHMTLSEREELQGAALKFAIADEHIDVFECCLTLLLEAALRDELERNDEHGWRTLRQTERAVQTLFAVLAAQGAMDPATAAGAFAAGFNAVLPDARESYAPVPHWPAALRDALHELAALRPLAKRELIEGLVRTVAHDRRLSVAEAELLRTVCALLHCPLPPILSA